MKRFVSWLVVMVLLMSMLCVPIGFAETGTEEEPVEYKCGDYTYTLDENRNACICDFCDYSDRYKELKIPETLDGNTVVGIESHAFFCKSLESITIPDSVTFIGTNPFNSCDSLCSIYVSQNHSTFMAIDNVLYEKINKKLICYPRGLIASEYTILNGIQVIGDDAFYCCKSLKNITIPDSVSQIGDTAFFDCESLKSVSIPDSVISIGVNPFAGCDSLSSILISPNHPTLSLIDNALFENSTKKLICYPKSLTTLEYTIPNGIQVIGDYAFFNCDSLKSIMVPDSVISIGDRAFISCDSLKSITIPNSVTSIGYETFYGCKSLKSIKIPDSVTFIDDSAFSNCKSVTLTVKKGSYAESFAKKHGLKYIYSFS